MEFKDIKKVYYIGIGGIGMSGLARLMMEKGIQVNGSDLVSNQAVERLQKQGVVIHVGKQEAKNITKDTDLVVYSSAVPVTHAQRQAAEKLGIPQMDYHEALGEFTKDATTIVVTGSHGKTTTTAMLASMLRKTDFNPSALVGAYVPGFEGNVHIGSLESYVLEGDEHAKGILYLHPSVVVLNNIEWDHIDVYPRESDYIEVFQDFVNKLPYDGRFIYNLDDHTIVEHIVKPECPAASFSINNQTADLYPKSIKIAHGRQIFKLVYKGNELKDFNIRVPGKHNVYNALGATLAALEMGVSQDTIKDVLAMYPGAWRRFEILDDRKGLVVSDYAHHPTEVSATIAAAKEFYPDKKIVVYFQPHHKNRTRMLLPDFIHALEKSGVDQLLIHEIYDVPGRSDDETISSQDIVKRLKRDAVYVDDFKKGCALLKKAQSKDTVIIAMGAGDIDMHVRDFFVKE